MRKLFSLFVALLATTSLWAEDFSVDGIYYNYLSGNNVKVTYRGDYYYSYDDEYSGAVIIPSTVRYNGTTYSVTSIGDDAFNGCSSLTSITIPNSVRSIGDRAFWDCSSLTSVTIGNSVRSIGVSAFRDCFSLTSIIIPNSVTNIGASAFSYCSSLTSVTIGNSVTSIGGSAFYYCSSLTSVTIPNSVTSIGGSAFQYCSSLTSVTIPNSVTSIGIWAFCDCSSLTSVTINSDAIVNKTYSYSSSIYDIFGSQVTEYIIGDDAKGIGRYAFYNCSSLATVTIGNSVTSIGYEAFSGCSSLTSVTIGNSVTSIGVAAFAGCSSLTSITIPNSVTSIGEDAFDDCPSLTSVTIPNSVTSIGYRAFSGCSSLTSMVVEEGNTIYDSRDNCNAIIETATNTLIAGCQNTIIPNNVTSIGYRAFSGCSSLTSVTIGNSVTSIEGYAFQYCSSLTSITCEATTPPTLGSLVFYGVSTSIPVYVPCEFLVDYQEDEGWSYFTNIQCISEEESAVDNVHSQSPISNCQKILRDGQLIILRDGVEYNAIGQEL